MYKAYPLLFRKRNKYEKIGTESKQRNKYEIVGEDVEETQLLEIKNNNEKKKITSECYYGPNVIKFEVFLKYDLKRRQKILAEQGRPRKYKDLKNDIYELESSYQLYHALYCMRCS